MRFRHAIAVGALAVTPLVSSCGINVGDCIDFGVATTKVLGYQAAIASGDMTEAEVAEARAEITEARGEVPEEVSDEFGVVADAFDEWFVQIEELGADDEITDAEWEEAATVFDPPEVQAALDELGNWAEENCVPS